MTGGVLAARRPGIAWAVLRARLLLLMELGAIVLLALWVGQFYIHTRATDWPLGQDFPLNVQGYFAWALLPECGACVLWSGQLNGGTPTFAELLSAVAHPLAVLLIALWGVIPGVKALVAVGLALAGLAQWWLARVLRLGLVARLWSAAMAVVGGHLAGRMENGLVEMVFSAAACSLVIPAMLHLAETGSRRATAVLGILVASALLAGQGYLQLGLLFGLAPAALLLLVQRDGRLNPRWRAFAWAGALSLLLTAFYWVPFLHFFANFSKPLETSLRNTQALAFLPLNLVIDDHAFYYSEALGKLAWPHLYANYIGWVPLLLAVVALWLIPPARRRTLLFFLAGVGLVYLAASGHTFRLLARFGPQAIDDLVAAVRFPSYIAALAVPLLLALAAWGLDLLLKIKWPRLPLRLRPGFTPAVNLAVVVAALPLLGAVSSAYAFGVEWLNVRIAPTDYYRLLPLVPAGATGWVEPPHDDWDFVVVGLEQGLKLTNVYRPWTWRDKLVPAPTLRITRDDVDPAAPGYVSQREYLTLLAPPEQAYAYVETGSARVPCTATALGGQIDVVCTTAAAGRLVVQENWWSGWAVSRDGAPVPLQPGDWLTTEAPAGQHTYAFRYRPWDVPVGLFISLLGVLAAVRLLAGLPGLPRVHSRRPTLPR